MQLKLAKVDPLNDEIQVVDLNAILANPNQPRKHSFHPDELEELAQTIRAVGLIHPPLVRQIAENQYELIAGERRFRAAQLAGLQQIPVIIRQTNKEKSTLAALIENIQRVDLNPIELAQALKQASVQLSLTQDALSQNVGIKRSSISNYLRLLTLPNPLQQAIADQRISLGHAKVLLSLEQPGDQMRLFEIIIRSNLSVREAEKKAQQFNKKQVKAKTKIPSETNIFLEQICDTLQSKLGTRVEFHGDEKKGSIELHYYSLSDLNRLLNELGYSEL